MNRIILIGIAGVAIIVAALGLNFWLNRDSVLETVTSPAETPRVVAEPESADESAAPKAEEQATAGGGKTAVSGQSGQTQQAQTESAQSQSAQPEKAVPQPSQSATTQPGAEQTAGSAPQASGTSGAEQSQTAAGTAGTGGSGTQANGQAQSGRAVSEAVPDTQSETTEKPDMPSFDVVRLSQQGDSVMAGRAKPGATVEILAGDKTIGTVQADERGEWVFLPTEPLAPGNHELSLRAKSGDGDSVKSDHVVVLVVPKKGEDVAGRKTEEDSQPLALLVPSEGGDGTTTILQKPSAVPGGVESETGDLALDSVDYDDKGDLALSGRGKPNASVRVYLNNDFVGEAPVDEEGRWQAKPPENVDPGVYDLRVDQVVEEKVVSRLELPFSRSGPITALKDEQLIIVQPGNSLWRIARRTLGEGLAYTLIYDANKSQIRDPDLIYPGQIFQVPKGAVN